MPKLIKTNAPVEEEQHETPPTKTGEDRPATHNNPLDKFLPPAIPSDESPDSENSTPAETRPDPPPPTEKAIPEDKKDATGISTLVNVGKQTLKKKTDRKSMWGKLNMARYTAELYSALLVHPSLNADETTLLEATTQLVQCFRTVCDKVIQEIAPPTSPDAFRARLSRAIAPLIAEAWIQTSGQPDTDKLSLIFIQITQQLDETSAPGFEDIDQEMNKLLAKSSIAASIIPVLQKIQQQNAAAAKFYIKDLNIEEAALKIVQEISDRALFIATNLAPDDGNDQNIAWHSAMRSLSQVGTANLTRNYNRVGHEINQAKNGTPEERTQLKEELNKTHYGLLVKYTLQGIDHYTKTLYPMLNLSQIDPNLSS